MATKTVGDLEKEFYESNAMGADSDYTSASASGAAGAANSAALPAVASKRNYLSGFVVSSGAPAANVGSEVTVTGVQGGTLRFQLAQTTGQGGMISVSFPRPLPASAVNTAITVSIPLTAGGAATSVAVWGFVK